MEEPSDGCVWRAAGVSVCGFSHEDRGVGCDDHHNIEYLGRGWILALVADGAGSARFGGRGAELTTTIMPKFMKELVHSSSVLIEELEPTDTAAQENWIRSGIEAVRTALIQEAHATSSSIGDFHTTLVGFLGHQSGKGLFFHIGDGAAYAQAPDISSEYVISAPENGEFAETTYFITESHWKLHLRFTSVPHSYREIVLMSDGAAVFAITDASPAAPFEPFLRPVIQFLRNNPREDAEASLASTLSQDRVRTITGDDKTLVWLLRGET